VSTSRQDSPVGWYCGRAYLFALFNTSYKERKNHSDDWDVAPKKDVTDLQGVRLVHVG